MPAFSRFAILQAGSRPGPRDGPNCSPDRSGRSSDHSSRKTLARHRQTEEDVRDILDLVVRLLKRWERRQTSNTPHFDRLPNDTVYVTRKPVELTVSVSLGTAEYRAGENPDDLVAGADQSMYVRKKE